jgi:hypothetical protein
MDALPSDPEPSLNLAAMLSCMGPSVTLCLPNATPVIDASKSSSLPEPPSPLVKSDGKLPISQSPGKGAPLYHFMSASMVEVLSPSSTSTSLSPPEMSMLGTLLTSHLGQIASYQSVALDRSNHAALPGIMSRLLSSTISLKVHGASVVKSAYPNVDASTLASFMRDWRVGCERVFTYARTQFSGPSIGVGCSAVLTDDRCRMHLTGPGSFERSVRLPAAVKGASNAGAGKTRDFLLLSSVEAEVSLAPAKRGKKNEEEEGFDDDI